MYKNLIFLSILLIACASTWKDRVYKKDGEFILKGRYPYQSFSLGKEGGEYRNIVIKLIEDIEKDPKIFDKIVETYFETYHPPFHYHITMLDKKRDNLIIRYFARFLRRKIYAGIGVMFIYNLKSKKIERIYIDLIPLE